MTNLEKEARKYLSTMTEMHATYYSAHAKRLAYICWEDYINQHGKFYKPRKLPAPYRYSQPKQCFENAYNLAKRHPDKLLYVEGIAYAMIPTEHAWCCTLDGQVIDPTWKFNIIEPSWYVGVSYPLEVVKAIRNLQRPWLHVHHRPELLSQLYNPNLTPEEIIRLYTERQSHGKTQTIPALSQR